MAPSLRNVTLFTLLVMTAASAFLTSQGTAKHVSSDGRAYRQSDALVQPSRGLQQTESKIVGGINLTKGVCFTPFADVQVHDPCAQFDVAWLGCLSRPALQKELL